MADDVPKLLHENDPAYCVYPNNDENNPLEITDEMTRNRLYFGQKYAYALPTQDALNTIMEYEGEKGFLEVGAGLGYWARLLKDMGAKIVATDIKGDERGMFTKGSEYTHVIKMDALTATKTYPDLTLIMVYPYGDWPIEVIKAYTGEYLIIVAGDDGCFNNDLMTILWGEHTEWSEIEKEPHLSHVLDVTHWPGFPAHLHIFQRTKPEQMATEILTNIHNRVLRLELHTKRHAPTLDG
jgi:hypothetical protein